MKMIEKNSPIIRPRIVALVNRPLTQYRMRVPMVPSWPGTLSAWSAPRPFPRSIEKHVLQSRITRRIRHPPETVNISYCYNLPVVDNPDSPSMSLCNVQVVSRQDSCDTSLGLTVNPVFH